MIVTGSVTVMPKIRTSPRPRADADRPGVEHPDRLHLGHPARLASMSARTAQTRSIGASMTIERADRLGLGALAPARRRIRSTAHGDAGPDAMASRMRAADHRITVPPQGRPRPARISSSARSPSPGSRSTAAMASVRTAVCEAEPRGVERGRLDAVVGREAAARRRCRRRRRAAGLELGRDGLAGDRVAHREAGVAVLAVGALADPRRASGSARSGCSSAPHVSATQWTGQMPPSLAKCGRGRRVPVLGGDDERAVVARPARSRGRSPG